MKRTTIEDVAQAAGVSRQTVSRAINDKGEISPETKAKVMQAVDELGYRPNRMAQSMVTQRTHSIGLLVADITNPYFPEVIRGVQDLAQANRYNVFVCNTDDQVDVEMKELHSLAAQGVDGIIVVSVTARDEKLKGFADTYGPLVLVNRVFDHPNISCIKVDHFRGAQLAVEHFVNCQRVLFGALTHSGPDYLLSQRLFGFKQRILEYGLTFSEDRVISSTADLDGGYEAAHQLFEQYPDTNAVFTYNDLMAIGALRACKERGLRVPDDISVIGFDDIQLARMISPALTTVHVDKYALGQIAMHRLMDMMNTPDETYPLIEIAPELVVRESTQIQI